MQAEEPQPIIEQEMIPEQEPFIGDNDVETAILSALGDGLRSGEDIMRQTKLPPEVFNQSIAMLEIKGCIYSLGMNNWALK